MSHSDYEMFSATLAGHTAGIDVIAEIVDKKRPVSEVVEEVRRKQPKS